MSLFIIGFIVGFAVCVVFYEFGYLDQRVGLMIDRRALAKRWLTAAQVEAGPRRLSKQQCRVIIEAAFKAADDHNRAVRLAHPPRARRRA